MSVSVGRIEMIPQCIGGVFDHFRHLVNLRTRLAVAKAVQLIKEGSLAWIHQRFPNVRRFAWQRGRFVEQELGHNRTPTFTRRVFSLSKETTAQIERRNA